MAEDLGFIEVRLPEDRAGQIQASGSAGVEGIGRKVGEAVNNNLSGFKASVSKLGALKDVFETATRGGGARATLAAAGEAAGKLGGGSAAVSIASAVAGIGLAVAAVKVIQSFVGGILDRITELARVNAAMAREAAQNKLAEISRDIKEARVMGPMYSQVSSMSRGIMNSIQPILLGLKTSVLVSIIPILKIIEVTLSVLNWLGSWIVQGFGMIYSAIGQGLQLLGSLLVQFSQNIPGMLDPGGVLSGIFNAIGTTANDLGKSVSTVGATLDGIAQMMRNQQKQNANPNAWAMNTLNALATSAQQSTTHGKRTRGVVT